LNRKEYIDKYPNYCKECNGYGGTKTYSPNFQMKGCQYCFEKFICPKCEGDLNDLYECANCNWTLDDEGGLPEE
jgi:hypothetical protein